MQVCKEHTVSSAGDEGRERAHVVECDVPRVALHRLERGDGDWHVPDVNLGRVGVEGEETEIKVDVDERNARLAVGVQVEVKLFQKVLH